MNLSITLSTGDDDFGQAMLSSNKWNTMHWAKRNRIKKTWNYYVGMLAKAKGWTPPEKSTVTLQLYFSSNRQRDIDNYTSVPGKLILDGLFGSRGDDSSKVSLNPVELYVDKSNPRIEVQVD